jgi:hypothetical protein
MATPKSAAMSRTPIAFISRAVAVAEQGAGRRGFPCRTRRLVRPVGSDRLLSQCAIRPTSAPIQMHGRNNALCVVHLPDDTSRRVPSTRHHAAPSQSTVRCRGLSDRVSEMRWVAVAENCFSARARSRDVPCQGDGGDAQRVLLAVTMTRRRGIASRPPRA